MRRAKRNSRTHVCACSLAKQIASNWTLMGPSLLTRLSNQAPQTRLRLEWCAALQVNAKLDAAAALYVPMYPCECVCVCPSVCVCAGHVIMFYVYASCTCNKDKAISYKNFLIACTNDALQQLDHNYNEANKTAESTVHAQYAAKAK